MGPGVTMVPDGEKSTLLKVRRPYIGPESRMVQYVYFPSRLVRCQSVKESVDILETTRSMDMWFLLAWQPVCAIQGELIVIHSSGSRLTSRHRIEAVQRMGETPGGWYEVYHTPEDAQIAWWLLECPIRAHQYIRLSSDFPQPILS